jgi:anti-anti-sigma factor
MDGIAIVCLCGCLAVRSLDIFHRVAQLALEASPHILVDLAHVEFVDSSALGALLALGNQAQFAGGGVSLAAVPAHIHHTLALLKLEKLFPIYPDVEAYLAGRASKEPSVHPMAAGQVPSPSGSRSWTVLKACRVLDASTAQDLIDAGAAELTVNPFLICDLSETIFLGSAGLAALTQLRRMALSQQGDFRIVNCSNDALRVIKMARFDRVLPVYSSFSLAAA